MRGAYVRVYGICNERRATRMTKERKTQTGPCLAAAKRLLGAWAVSVLQ